MGGRYAQGCWGESGWRDELPMLQYVRAPPPPPPPLPTRPLPFLGTGPGIWPLLPAGARSQQAEVGRARRQGCLGNGEAAVALGGGVVLS